MKTDTIRVYTRPADALPPCMTGARVHSFNSIKTARGVVELGSDLEALLTGDAADLFADELSQYTERAIDPLVTRGRLNNELTNYVAGGGRRTSHPSSVDSEGWPPSMAANANRCKPRFWKRRRFELR